MKASFLLFALIVLGTVISAQQQVIEYGADYTDGVMSSGGVPWKAGIVYDFGANVHYLEKIETKWDAAEDNMGWKVTTYGTTTPTLNVIAGLSGTFNYTDADEWQTFTINSSTPITGKVAFLIETEFNSIYNDFDHNDSNGDWMYYSADGQWYHNSGYGGGANAIRITVNNNPLPVELTNFYSNTVDNKIQLFWSTATEVENIGFEIQRSSSSITLEKDWTKIGFVDGAGTSNSPKEYTFIDNEVSQSGEYYYRLKQIDNDGSFEYSNEIEVIVGVPSGFSLCQNYPNPFNPATVISYTVGTGQLSVFSEVQIKVYDVLGKEVATLVNETQPAGNYSVDFNGAGLPSGIYFYRIAIHSDQLQANGFIQTKKMILLK